MEAAYVPTEKGGKAKVKVLLKHQIIKFCFISVFIYERLKSMDKTILLSFGIAAVAFLILY